MFGNLLGDMEAKQKALKEKMSTMFVEAKTGGIKVTANVNREITNVSIDKEKINLTDTEELEDLLTVTINKVLEMAAEKEAVETQNLMKDMMPPGLGGLGDMFGS